MTAKLGKYIPGLLLLLGISLISILIAGQLPDYIGSVFIAVIIGVIINNFIKLDLEQFNPGVGLGLKKILKLAIVLLGGTISLQQLATVGFKGLLIIITIISLAFAATFLLGRVLNISNKRKILIAAGLSICGNTAIITSAPLIEAEDNDIFVAVSIVTLFGVLAVFLFPFIGLRLGLSDIIFGSWAGTAVNDTSQVVATGFIFSEEAGRIATMIKLSRNILMVPIIVLIGYFYSNSLANKTEEKINLIEIFPNFILGFLFLIILNSTGLIPVALGPVFDNLSQFLILLALSGIGLGVNLQDLKKVGFKPFLLGFTVAILMAVVSLSISRILFI